MVMKKCVACKKRNSVSVDEPGIAQLCKPCWRRVGKNVRVGSKIICTIAHPDCSGTVDEIDGGMIHVNTVDGGDAWIPRAEALALPR
jgi:hypothetical protein